MTEDFSAITAAIGAATGRLFSVSRADPVGGGSIHDAWRLVDGERQYFVKRGNLQAAAMFAAEADGLEALARAAVLRTPTVVTRGSDAAGAFLVLEHLDLRPLEAVAARRLGEQLAALHRLSAERYGWGQDNYIGLSPQLNDWQPAWPRFFATRRLLPQLTLARRNGMDSRLAESGEAIAEKIAGLFLDYRPQPSLLHGDLWGGNAAQANGEPVIFDPACYYGDREADLAMTELFGGFPEAFYVAYRESWPLDAGYETRKTLYNLYHILNHYNLFGAAYLGQARRMIEALRERLRRS